MDLLVEAENATKGMIVTTSSFTKGAVIFRDTPKYQMEPADLERNKYLLKAWRS